MRLIPFPTLLASLPLLALSMLQYAQAQSVDCLVTPSDPSCVAFELPAATTKAALDGLCAQMPYMPGCSLYKSCQASSKTDQWCMPFSILADICAVDMPGMQGCQSYVSLCGPGGSTNKTMVSRPAVCDKSPMIASFPTTKNASALVIDICTEMDMAGCERCPKPPPGAYAADCDTLSTYAILCKAMPDMHQCASWKSMCSPTSDTSSLNFQSSEYCTAGVGSPDMNPPAMRMYFHTGFSDYVLFEKWVPRNQGQFVGAWFALFFLTLLFQAIQTYHNGLEGLWAEELARHADDASKTNSSVSLMGLDTNSDARSSSILLHWIHIWRQPWTLKEGKQNVIRAFLTFVETTLGYSLMLVTMTFNVGLFFAVIAGFTVGSVMFSRQKSVAIVKSSAVASSGTGCAGCG